MKKASTTDEYISNANEFAIPILKHLRKLIHDECPDVKEVIKWGFPCFEFRGILCAVTAHKEYCSFSFWKGAIMSDPDQILQLVGKTSMGQLGRINSIADLPSDNILRKYINEAIELNNKGIKVPKKETVKKELEIPTYFLKAVKSNESALSTFEGFSYSNKKEYVEWVTEAKTEATRNKRLEQSVIWMAEGKIRNWRYVK